MPTPTNFLLIGKSVFFPSSGILAISDLHLGYENMLKTEGFEFPIKQLKETKRELEKIFEEIKKRKMKLKKIIILGDLKHLFGFGIVEKYEIRDFLNFLERFVKKENIILIKGNHEKISLDKREYKFFHLEKNLAFLHGDKLFPEILNKRTDTIIVGHLHPAIFIQDPNSHKKEKYKCFLVGEVKVKDILGYDKKNNLIDEKGSEHLNCSQLKGRGQKLFNKSLRGDTGGDGEQFNKKITCIVLPSFLQIREGTDIKTEYENKKNWAFIPKKQLLKFRAFVVGEKNRTYDFGVLGKMKK